MQKMLFAATLALATALAGFATVASAANNGPLDARTIGTIESRFGKLMELANKHDIKGLHAMFWQSPSALLVAKSAVPSEGNWAGFWGNDAIDQKLHDIAASGPVVLTPDLSKLKVVGLTLDIAESYAPMKITVSYAGQDGTPKPFLMIITWKKIAKDWKVASEIILPVPPTRSPKNSAGHSNPRSKLRSPPPTKEDNLDCYRFEGLLNSSEADRRVSRSVGRFA